MGPKRSRDSDASSSESAGEDKGKGKGKGKAIDKGKKRARRNSPETDPQQTANIVPIRSTEDSNAANPTNEEDESRQLFVASRYGHLGEGYSNGPSLSLARQAQLRRQYQNRRDLAQYALYPEGLLFRPADQVNARDEFLLTPPEMIAVRRQDGSWFRRMRNHVTDPPAPYPRFWYRIWLRAMNLPDWFMTPEHLIMLERDGEANALHIPNAPTSASVPAPNYLETLADAEMRFPDPWRENGMPYRFPPPSRLAERLAVRFPFLRYKSLQTKFYPIVVPTGHMLLRRRRQIDHLPFATGKTTVMSETDLRDEARRRGHETPPHPLASYIIETENTTQRAPPPSRSDLINSLQEEGWLVNPNEVPLGEGEWRWLDPEVDQPLALALGFTDPAHVTRGRRDGLLALGTGPNAGPSVAWLPDHTYLNPDEQPEGPGAWRFLTESAENLASINYGGNMDHGLEGIPVPSAAQIWTLRRIYAQNGLNFASEIEIVWDRDARDTAVDVDSDGAASPVAGPSGTQGAESAEAQPAPDEGDPTNGRAGEIPWDQTGQPGQAFYQTRQFGGQDVTIDRSRAHAGDVEPHKLYVYSGQDWKKYGSWKAGDRDNASWNDADLVKKLNNWREQFATRVGWPKKRTESRSDYTEDQERFLWRYLRTNPDGEVDTTRAMAEIAAAFNQRFSNNSRSEGALGPKIARLKQRFESNNGEYAQSARPRGWLQKQLKAAKVARAQNPAQLEDQEDDEQDEPASDPGPEEEDEEEEESDDNDGDKNKKKNKKKTKKA